MKHPIPRPLALGAAVAAALAAYGSRAQTVPADGHHIAPRAALPYPQAIPAKRLINHDGNDRPTPGGPATAPTGPAGAPPLPPVATAFTIDDIAYLPLLVQTVDGDEWYMQCVRYTNGQGGCFKIVPAEAMAGLRVSSTLSADGSEPILVFAQTAPPPSAAEASRQSAMVEAFTSRYNEALIDIRTQADNLLRTATGARARAPAPAKKETESCDGGDCGDGADGGGGGGGGGGGSIPTVPVHGKPDPAPPPPDYQPVPLTPRPIRTTYDDASIRLAQLSTRCSLVPGPEGPVMYCVAQAPRRNQEFEFPKDPNAIPQPPAGWDWCRDSNICTATNFPPPDPRGTACDVKYGVDLAVCFRDYGLGRKNKDQMHQCEVLASAARGKCHATLGRLLGPLSQ